MQRGLPRSKTAAKNLDRQQRQRNKVMFIPFVKEGETFDIEQRAKLRKMTVLLGTMTAVAVIAAVSLLVLVILTVDTNIVVLPSRTSTLIVTISWWVAMMTCIVVAGVTRCQLYKTVNTFRILNQLNDADDDNNT